MTAKQSSFFLVIESFSFIGENQRAAKRAYQCNADGRRGRGRGLLAIRNVNSSS